MSSLTVAQRLLAARGPEVEHRLAVIEQAARVAREKQELLLTKIRIFQSIFLDDETLVEMFDSEMEEMSKAPEEKELAHFAQGSVAAAVAAAAAPMVIIFVLRYECIMHACKLSEQERNVDTETPHIRTPADDQLLIIPSVLCIHLNLLYIAYLLYVVLHALCNTVHLL